LSFLDCPEPGNWPLSKRTHALFPNKTADFVNNKSRFGKC
jgi:hypothetical protein